MIAECCGSCQAHADGWCEYDAFEDTVYPVDDEKCLIGEGK